MPQIPNETRWKSKEITLETYIDNHAIYMEISEEVANDRSIPSDVTKIIDNVSFKRKASACLQQMKNFSVALDKLQSDSCYLSDAVKVWYSLLRNPDLSQHKKAVKKRFNEAVEPFFFLAYMTDHRNIEDNENKVDPEDELAAEKWLENYDTELFSMYIKFQIKKEEKYPKYFFSESMRSTLIPKKWWMFVKMKAEKRDDQEQVRFATFMVNLHSCPSSSSSLERWFSTFGFVWSKTRNRLGHEKAMKLVKIYRKLRE